VGPPSARQAQRQIDEENAAMLKRLQSCSTHYSKEEQLKEFEMHEGYLRNITSVPPLPRKSQYKVRKGDATLSPIKTKKQELRTEKVVTADGSQTARGCLEGVTSSTTTFVPRAPPKNANPSKRPRPKMAAVPKPTKANTKNRTIQPAAVAAVQQHIWSASERLPPFDRSTCKCFKRLTHSWKTTGKATSSSPPVRSMVSFCRSADRDTVYVSAFLEGPSQIYTFALPVRTARSVTNLAVSAEGFCKSLLQSLVLGTAGTLSLNASSQSVGAIVQQHEAAKLQAHFRGRKDRKMVEEAKEQQHAIVKIQSQIRAKSDRKKTLLVKEQKEAEHDAILKIQSQIRGKVERKKTLVLVQEKNNQDAIVKIQSQIRGKTERKKTLLLKEDRN
jgi:hypothetical protein